MRFFETVISNQDCSIYRFIALVFTVVSMVSFSYNVQFLIFDRQRLNPLALGLIANSMILIFISLPYVLVQAIQCTPIDSDRMCFFQGFICFTCGISVMYTMSLLAFVQYIRLFYNASFIHRILISDKNCLIPFLCWFMSLFWSLPTFLDVKPGFLREGYGFDCGLNWFSTDFQSLLYLFLAFFFIYFLPLICLLFTNIRIFITIRRLIYRRETFLTSSDRNLSIQNRHRLIDVYTVAESTRLKRLRIDRRFAQAIMITVLHYLLAWTPYAVGGLSQMFFALEQISFQPPAMFLTAAALTAKLAVIGQACVYYFTVRPPVRRVPLKLPTLK